jgi:hypothetical protein
MFRALAYLLVGWLLIAAVPGLAHVLQLTVMLPSTTAVLITHLAFAREEHDAPVGLALAIALGYLEDLHQGAPVGTLALTHGLGFLSMRWFSARMRLTGPLSRSVAAVVAVLVIDLATWTVLFVLADSLGIVRDALAHGLWQVRWHALATFLVAHPVWHGLDAFFRLLRLRRTTADVEHLRRS